KRIELFKSRIQVLKDLRRDSYDYVVNFEPKQTIKMRILSSLLRAKEKIGIYTSKKIPTFYHQSVFFPSQESEFILYKTIGKILGCGNLDLSFPFFHPTKEEENRVIKLLPNTGRMMIGIHPGCGQRLSYKRWSKERFAELSRRLILKKNASILIFGGHDEVRLAETIIEKADSDHIYNLAGKFTIRETVAAVARCSRFISNDSGLMHLSAAMGLPVIALFGPSSSIKNAPVGEKYQLLCGDGCELSNNQMCPECRQAWESESKIPRCLENLKVETVMDLI
ncbi:glycosyltransferase family 9 protein, partial [bacterium]|nr:glycosyltransferase family 9 protein [bacterium]